MVLIGHASIGENGKVNYGKPGDQTGKEVCIRSWYNKPWSCLIRFKDPKMAEKIADCMEMACRNDFIGYSQTTRNSLLKEARKYNYDVSKVKVYCNTDCSALVSVCCMYAGVPESTLTLDGNCATTRTLTQLLKSTGNVQTFTTQPYIGKTDKLKRGDILIKPGSHVVVVVQTDTKSLEEIAREVIAGKWGNGMERRAKLTDAGYNYAMVQAKVKELMEK